MKKPLCLLIALATLLLTVAPLSAASYKTGSSGGKSSKGGKSSITRINPASGSSKSSSSTRKKSSGTRKTSSSSDGSSSRRREPKNVRGKEEKMYVEGHYTKKGTYVAPHLRGAPDGDKSNNRDRPKRKTKY
jgi:hypothetical protein